MDQTAPAQRPEYEKLIDEFTTLDEQCQQLIEKFTNGKILFDCVPSDGAATYEELFTKMVAKFVAVQDHVKQLIEKRNAKLQEAASAMRGSVIAPDNVTRGPDAKAEKKTYGAFEVTSKTNRNFDPNILIPQVQQMGLLERMMAEAQYMDKDTGVTEPAIQQVWEIKYEAVKQWLRETNLEKVVEVAYEEVESTPAVTCPAPIGWLGDADKKKRGKGKK